MKSFDLNATPLERGTTLLEASAGTGKTYTIAGLFLRLLLDRALFPKGGHLSVREILVVTFTKAATEELRGRIRTLLAEAARAFRGGETKHPLLLALLAAHGESEPRREALARLDLALAGFDEAPIFTIHGFCQRTLKDRAFESGSLFDAELVKNQSGLLQEIADDFWRRQFYDADPARVCFALAGGLDPEVFFKSLRDLTNHPQLRILSRVAGRSLETLAAEMDAARAAAGEFWRTERDALRPQFGAGAKWAKKPYNDEEQMVAAFAQLDRFFGGDADESGAEAITLFTTGALDEGIHKVKKKPRPDSPFFERCAELLRRAEDWRLGLRVGFLDFARGELPRRKERLKMLSFDDLLTHVHAALSGPAGAAMAEELRGHYRAALIDEFQDTDPVQYQIFRRTFTGPEALLFLIGDPKQAIYGFRGADIFTYLDAAGAADRRYTLGENWRSSSSLVRAVNTVFGNVERPFFEERIGFRPVVARGEADQKPLVIPGDDGSPLRLWFCPREDAKPLSKGAMEPRLTAAVAAEITRLLNSQATLGGRALRPEDIAVLVDKNEQASAMQAALTALNVPSVLHTEAGVFATGEAEELARVLTAIEQPMSERLVRAALATDLLGVKAEELAALGCDDAPAQSKWQAWLESFRRAHELWLERGFMPMFRQWLQEHHVRARLLAFPDGERRLTNLLHLAEALHQAAAELRLGLGGVLQWLAGQRDPATQAAEEHQLRLERDDNAVRLVTVHKAKGLEYEIVFCPFVWRNAEVRNGGVLFHDPAAKLQLTRDLGSEQLTEHERLAMNETLAENLRLLYVALTRARQRCYVAWGAFNKSGTAAPVWLWHPPETGAPDPVAAMAAQLDRPDDELRADLRRLAVRSRAGGAHPVITVEDLSARAGERYAPEAAPGSKLKPREFQGSIPRDWRIASFSWLTAGRRDEAPDHDPAPVRVPEPEAATGIFAFPRGTQAGTCLHEIFEKLDFTKPARAEIEPVVLSCLRAHAFKVESHAKAVIECVHRVLRVPLLQSAAGSLPADQPFTESHSKDESGSRDAPGNDAGALVSAALGTAASLPPETTGGRDAAPPRSSGEAETSGGSLRAQFTLTQVPGSARLDELEFCFPLRKVAPERLRAVFAKHGRDKASKDHVGQMGRLEFNPVAGFMKGFMDLVFERSGKFHLVDWKSNWLGNRVEDYDAPALEAAMNAHHYHLQYHLYTLALDRYLALRLRGYNYARDFGGVFYVFLRGVDPARPEFGVFHDRPAPELMQELRAVLLEEGR